MLVVPGWTIGYRRRRMTSNGEETGRKKRAGWRWWWPLAAALTSGGLATLCFAPWNQEWLCWLALTPLLAALWSLDGDESLAVPTTGLWWNPAFLQRLAARRWARGFALGYAAGLVFFWGAFYWLAQVTGIGWFILPFYMALYFAAWGVFMATIGRPGVGKDVPDAPEGGRAAVAQAVFRTPLPASTSPLLRSRWNLWFAFLGAASWTGLEWVRGWMFSGFGWNDLGVAMHGNIAFIQIVSWTGVG